MDGQWCEKKEEISSAGRFGNEWKTHDAPLPPIPSNSYTCQWKEGEETWWSVMEERERETTKTDLLRPVVSSLGFFGVAVGKGMEDADKREQEQKGFRRLLFFCEPTTFTLFFSFRKRRYCQCSDYRLSVK